MCIRDRPDKGLPGQVVRIHGGFIHIENRCDAGVTSFKHGAPLGTRPLDEGVGQQLAQVRPLLRIPAPGEGLRREFQLVDQQVVELRFDRPDGQPLSIGASIGAVKSVSYTHLDVYKRQAQ